MIDCLKVRLRLLSAPSSLEKSSSSTWLFSYPFPTPCSGRSQITNTDLCACIHSFFYSPFVVITRRLRRADIAARATRVWIHGLVRGNRPGKPVQLQEYEIKYLCTKAREIFINQPILLELEAPIKICGAFFIYIFSLELFMLC